jgi:uncharacterized membrane protein
LAFAARIEIGAPPRSRPRPARYSSRVTRAREFRWFDVRLSHQRLILAVLLGVIAWFVTPARLSAVTRGLIAGDVAGLVLLGIAVWIFMHADSEQTRARAAAQDPGRTIVWLIVLGVSALSLFAATFVMRGAKTLPGDEADLVRVLAVSTAGISWLLTHAGFTLRYAHLYYRGGREGEGGIAFPGHAEPDDLDFAYFAFTIGMTFQVSDAQIKHRLIRRTALLHALVSFAYNTGIIALVLNIVMNQLA